MYTDKKQANNNNKMHQYCYRKYGNVNAMKAPFRAFHKLSRNISFL